MEILHEALKEVGGATLFAFGWLLLVEIFKPADNQFKPNNIHGKRQFATDEELKKKKHI